MRRALELCRFPAGAELADIGCGRGESVRYVNENTDYKMTGIDNDPSTIEVAADTCLAGDACALPFAPFSLEGIFFECSLSTIAEPAAALGEARRVLKRNGKIVVADFFAREKEERFAGIMGRVEYPRTIIARLNEAGFEPLFFEDRTHDLRRFWGQLIFDHGKETLDALLGGCQRLVSAKCGYGLFIAEKTGAE